MPAYQSNVTDDDFIALFRQIGPAEMERRGLGSKGRIFRRRRTIEKRLHIVLTPPDEHYPAPEPHPEIVNLDIRDGIVLVGSDAHYWPGPASTAHRAFVHFCKEMKPRIVIKNGDALDFATISRHAPIGWETRPTVQQEIECAQERLGEIELAAGKARKIWPLGNHDARLETRLATVAPEFAKVAGVHLQDHFPLWEPCWRVDINSDVVVKHRYRGGIHATRNNALNAGKTMVTGHLHQLKITPVSDYTGTRFGVDCGTMADPYGPQFRDYTEMNPVDWRSGFIVLTFFKGRLLWPEPVHVLGAGEVEFRGKVMRV